MKNRAYFILFISSNFHHKKNDNIKFKSMFEVIKHLLNWIEYTYSEIIYWNHDLWLYLLFKMVNKR